MTVRAAVMTAPNRPVEVQSFDDPVLEPGSALLHTVASEVCGTDVHLYHGRLDGVPYPIIPGHVSVGRIVEVAGDHRDVAGAQLGIGDLVTFYDVHEVCHDCWFCLVARQPNRCPSRKVYGITYSARDGLLGGWSERIYLKPGVHIFRIPDGLAVADVIGGGCGLFTGFASVDRADVQMGDVVLVQGAGPVGMSAAAFSYLSGASRVIMIGDPAARLEIATTLGADDAMSLSDTTLDERAQFVRDATGGRGADVVIEASGNPRAVEEGLALLRDAGRYVVAGHYTDGGDAVINPHIHINRKHADIRGQWGTDLGHVARALALLAKHRLPFGKVIGGRYGLEDAQRALDDVAALEVTKAIITPNGDGDALD